MNASSGRQTLVRSLSALLSTSMRMTETHHPSDIIPGMEGIIHHLTDGNEFKEYVPCKGQGSTGYGFS